MILLDGGQIEVLRRECAIMSSLSLAGSLVVVATHYHFPHLRTRSAKLVVYLSLSVAGSDLTGLAYLGGGSCSLYGFFTSFFLIAIALWSATISRTLQLVVVHRNELSRSLTRLNSMVEDTRFGASRNSSSSRDGGGGVGDCSVAGRPALGLEFLRMAAFHVAVWGISFTCALGIVILSVRAPISSWCWFEASNPDNAATTGQLLFFYMPISVALCYNFYVLGGTYLKAYMAARGPREDELELQDGLSSDLKALSSSLCAYVLFTVVMLVLVCLAELVNLRAFPRYSDASPERFWLYFSIVLLVRMQGVYNLFVYSRRPDVRAAWGETFARALLRRPRQPTEASLGGEAFDDSASEFQSSPASGKLLLSTPSASPYQPSYFDGTISTSSTPQFDNWGGSQPSLPSTPLVVKI